MSDSESSELIAKVEQLVEDEQDHTSEILAFLDHPRPEVRDAAIWALWGCELTSIREPLLEKVEQDPEESVRGSAIAVLARFVLEGLLASSEGEADEEPTQGIKSYLREILGDDSRSHLLRRRALESLAFDPDEALEERIGEWIESENELFRKSAAYALGRANLRRFDKQLLKALEDSSPMVLVEAIRSVGDLGLKKAIPKLKEIASEADGGLCEEAVLALAQIGGAKVEKILEKLEKEGDEARAEAARRALAELHGED